MREIVATCRPWQGRPTQFQAEAIAVIVADGNRVGHYAWASSTCETEMCLHPDHLIATDPIRLAYPRGVCVYCGRPGYAKDHLVPRAISGETERRLVAIVPACGECNHVLGDVYEPSVVRRRLICHTRLRRKHRRVLATLDFTPEDLRTYGPTLRKYLKSEMQRKRDVLALFEWPTDPNYDMRALQRSGIDDPVSAGLLSVA